MLDKILRKILLPNKKNWPELWKRYKDELTKYLKSVQAKDQILQGMIEGKLSLREIELKHRRESQ